jgi:prophage antirepressor-like protein
MWLAENWDKAIATVRTADTSLSRPDHIRQAYREATKAAAEGKAKPVPFTNADEKGLHTVLTPGGPQKMTAITEAGLYRLIMLSRKPVAKPFQDWVTREDQAAWT